MLILLPLQERQQYFGASKMNTDETDEIETIGGRRSDDPVFIFLHILFF